MLVAVDGQTYGIHFIQFVGLSLTQCTTHYRTTNTTRTHEHNGWTQAWRTAAMLEVEVTMHADRPPPPYRPHHVNGAPILPLIGAIDARCRRLLLLGRSLSAAASSPLASVATRSLTTPRHHSANDSSTNQDRRGQDSLR